MFVNIHQYCHRLYRYLWIEIERLTLWVPVVFVSGCLIYFRLPAEPLKIICLLIFGWISLCLIMIYFFRNRISLEVYHLVWTIWLIMAGFCWSWWQTYRSEPFYQVPTRSTIIQGVVEQTDTLPMGKRRILIKDFRFLTPPESDQQPWHRKLQITLSDKDKQSLIVGDNITASVMLSRPLPPVIVGGYDFQFQAWFHHIGAYGYALKPIIIKHKETSFYSLQLFREKIVQHIRKILPNDSGIIAQILLTGMNGQLSQENRHAFAASGLAHLLAIAGLHLGIVMMIVTLAMRWLLLRSEYLALHWPIKTIAVIMGWIVGVAYL